MTLPTYEVQAAVLYGCKYNAKTVNEPTAIKRKASATIRKSTAAFRRQKYL